MLAGTVAFAEEPEEDAGCNITPFDTYAPLIIQKVWNDGLPADADRPKVTVKYTVRETGPFGEEAYYQMERTISAKDDWRLVLSGDVAFDSEYVEGYITDYKISADTIKVDNREYYLCTITNTKGYTVSYDWEGLPDPENDRYGSTYKVLVEDAPRDERISFEEKYNIKPPSTVAYQGGDPVTKVDHKYGPEENNIVCIDGTYYQFMGWEIDAATNKGLENDPDTFDMPYHNVHYTGRWEEISALKCRWEEWDNWHDVLSFVGIGCNPEIFPVEGATFEAGDVIPNLEKYLENYRYTFGQYFNDIGTPMGTSYYIDSYQIKDSEGNPIGLQSDGSLEIPAGGAVIDNIVWEKTEHSITCEATPHKDDKTISPYDLKAQLSYGLLSYRDENFPGQHYREGDVVPLPEANVGPLWLGHFSKTYSSWRRDRLLGKYYKCVDWEVTEKASGDPVSVDGGYFTMPDGDVIIKAIYKSTPEEDVDCPTVTYVCDVVDENGNPVMNSAPTPWQITDLDFNSEFSDSLKKPYYVEPGHKEYLYVFGKDKTRAEGAPSKQLSNWPGYEKGYYYVFEGWKVTGDDGSSIDIIDGDGTLIDTDTMSLPYFEMPNCNVTVAGKWIRKENGLHNVTFEAVADNGSVLDSNFTEYVRNYSEGHRYSGDPPLLEGIRDQYYFFTVLTLGQIMTFDGDAYVYQGWTAATANGAPIDNSNEGVYWKNSTSDISSRPFTNYFVMPDEDVVITTHWEKATFRVSYGDGNLGNNFDQVDQGGNDLGIETPEFDPEAWGFPEGTYEQDENGKWIPVRPGYEFKGWSPEPTDEIIGCVTYMPIWERQLGYIVIYEDGVPEETVFRNQEFDKNVEDPAHAEDLLYAGDTTPRFPVLDKDADVGESTVDPETGENIPVREGYRFLGWRLKSGQSPDPEGEPGGVRPNVRDRECYETPPRTIVYEAIWEKTDGPEEPGPGDDEGYTVIYRDGANGEAFAEQTYNRKDDGETLIYAGDDTPPFQPKEGDDGPVRPGYRFIGWSILSGEEKDPDTIIEVREKVQAKDSDEDPPRTIIYEARWERLLPEGTKCGVLVISKTVTGGGNPEQEFTFNVTLTLPEDYSGEPENEVSYIGLGGKADGIIKLDENNRGTVTLKHGESVVIQRPSGTEYTVEEVLTSGYETTVEESHNTSGVFKTCEVAMVRVINRWMSSGTPAQYRVIHEYYTNGKYDGATRPEDFDGFVGQRINPDSIPRNWRYMGNVYNFRDITPSGLQVLTAGETLVFTLRYDRVEYTPSYPDPTPWPDPTPTPTPTPKPDPTPTPTPTPDPDPTPTPLPLPERPVDPGTGLVPYDPTVILEDLVPLAAPHLNITDHYAYIIGYPDGLVRPEGNVTRAEVATIFLRLMLDEYREENWSTENNFSDVAPTAWYNNAVSTCAKAGIIKGYPDGTFRPDANITRAEFAAIAARFVSDDVPGYDYFTDMEGHWARVDVARAVMAGWIRGEGRLFRPQDKITRAETATLVNRMINRFPDKDHLLPQMIRWPDNLESAWYYAEMQEATNSHDYEGGLLTMSEVWTYLLANRDWAALENEWSQAGDAPGGEVAPELQNGGTSSGESDDIQDILGDILGA